ncbi:hypothetical protein B0J18DRAFT_272454 [Chaetomium sp. MPI-SDFR-AT-0129]|nr:hypothetical protein B0J18DRAFT_272454 [Chaetomium sp. MPI-SDFR-AT-0129]
MGFLFHFFCLCSRGSFSCPTEWKCITMPLLGAGMEEGKGRGGVAGLCGQEKMGRRWGRRTKCVDTADHAWVGALRDDSLCSSSLSPIMSTCLARHSCKTKNFKTAYQNRLSKQYKKSYEKISPNAKTYAVMSLTCQVR